MRVTLLPSAATPRKLRSFRGGRAASLLLGLALALGARSVRAEVDDQTRASARDLALRGRVAYAAGDYEQARDLFHRAYALVRAPTVSLYEARALAQLGRLVEAAEAYMRTVQAPLEAGSPEPFQKAQEDAEVERTALKPRIPTLFLAIRATSGATGASVTSMDPGVAIEVDGKTLSRELVGVERPIDPGAHRAVLHVRRQPDITAAFTLAEGEHKRLELTVPESAAAADDEAPAAAPPAPPLQKDGTHGGTTRTLAVVSLGIGAVGIVTGVATGIWATSRHSEAVKDCPGNHCVPSSEGSRAVDDFRALRTVSTTGYVVGAVFALTGASLLFFTPSSSTSSPQARASRPVRVGVGLGRVEISGAF